MKSSKKIFFIVLVFMIALSSYGLMSYSYKEDTSKTINPSKEWDVAITNVEIKTSGNVEEGNTKYSEGTLVLDPIFNGNDGSIQYKVTIENKGLLDVKLSNVIYREDNKDGMIKYDISKPSNIIKSGEEIEVIIVAYLDINKYNGEEGVQNKLTALYEYVQE